MAFNGSGTYNLPAGNPVVTGTTISSSTTNTTNSDIATALTNCITRDGQSTPSANLPMNAKKLTGLAAGTSAGDSVRYEQVVLSASLGTNVATFLATPSSANLAAALTDETGSGANVFATSPTLVTPVLGTPSSGTLTSCTGLPLSTGVTGTLPVANGGTGVTTSTGSGNNVLSTSPTLVTPVLGTPSSGTLSSCTVDGTDAVGFRNIPINSQSAAYTAVLADSGKCIFHPSTDANARTFTIPANGSVAYPIGTAISFVNMTSQVVSIAITTDTMYLAGTGTTGTRSLAQYGTATALKMTSTTWIISGAGLT
jgi:hypothetical protein